MPTCAQQPNSTKPSALHLGGVSLLIVLCPQDIALRDIAHVLDQLRAGLLPDTKPLVLLFAGPSRCGKTETAEQVSKLVSDQSLDPQCFLNMGQFQLEQNVARLNGSDPGYVGSPDGELAFLGQRCRPIVILDEIEKACPAALTFFLSVFDKGQYKTGAGKVINCKSAIFIMTSNIGTDLLGRKAAILRELSLTSHQRFGDQELRPLFIEQGWRPEFWARIDMSVPFLPLSEQDCNMGARHFLQVSCCKCRQTFIFSKIDFLPIFDSCQAPEEPCKCSIISHNASQ